MRRGWVVAVLLVASGCGIFGRRDVPPPVVGGVQVGIASWYGPGFHGRPTASGEIYDQWGLTAAHQTLPLGTRVMVTSLENGRAVEVRINDRGPFVKRRIIDLSRAAAQTLHLIGPGTMQVRVEIMDAPATWVPPDARARPNDLGYMVQVGTFSRRESAEDLRIELARRFPDVHVSPVETGWNRYFRVRVGPFEARDDAEAEASRVGRLGYTPIIVRAPKP